MSAPPFEVVALEPVVVHGPASLSGSALMSPFVWRGAGGVAMLFRAVGAVPGSTGAIWFATGDGLAFHAGPAPVLAPGPGPLDHRGCEDPTLVPVDRGCLVYYTGVADDGSAQLLWASGPDIRTLAKRGVAHAATASDRNTKEAAVVRLDDRWLLLFEYSRDGRSRLGRAIGGGPSGPWNEFPDPLLARPGHWDDWHLSTGPLLVDEPGGPVMFYNGASRDAVWAIGWARFDPDCTRVLARSDEPLVAAPAHASRGSRITFAASVVEAGDDRLWLYYTHDDRSPMRATLRRRGRRGTG